MSCNFSTLEQEALLHISGPDALTFLQGQTTCDTRLVNEERAVPGAYCTPQGRVVCDFLLCRLAPEHYAMRLRRDIRERSCAVFGRYVIFSKATLEGARDDWSAFAIWGEQAGAVLGDIFGASPAGQFSATGGDGYLLVQVDDEGRQFECYLHGEQWFAALEERLQRAPESNWQALQIAAGIARIEAPTVEAFVPQVINYDLTGHISFDKGCYTGQEVVARLHYRGKPKRRTYLAELPGGAVAAAGAELFCPGQAQSVGHIVNTATAQGRILALVSATAGGVERGLLLGSPEGAPLTIGKLPYTVEVE